MNAAFDAPPGTGLLTDLYQLTMAYGYWQSGTAEKEAVFHLIFRKHPFHGGFTLACGLADALEYLRRLRFEEDDLAYLAGLTGRDGQPLFEHAFLDYLRDLEFRCDVDAVPEGTAVFPQEPLLRVQGPILQAQLVETALLYFINFQTLIATKAARVCLAARGEPVIEFGLRRAQGADGGVAAGRAAYIGGCAGTSNVLAGKILGLPVLGTHAHSWVMSFDSELEAFEAYAQAMPNNCVFLVDTYNSLEGVRRAVRVGQSLRAQGHALGGIRLDSGDLAYLSIEARKILDEAGFPQAVIVASNDLDEHIIASLKEQGARINVWGVGTKLITAYDQPALGGVYKLSAIRTRDGRWEHKVKLSEQAAKLTNPGILQVRRFRSATEFLGDAIYDVTLPKPESFTIVDPLDLTRRRHFAPEDAAEDLLVPVLRAGKQVCQLPALGEIRERVAKQLSMLNPGVKRFTNPHQYPVGLELGL
ncbi:MAG TPA: nicotinate phosphoribosyltransferase, partial [Candidatus Sulfotelmatobacter sp.]|nr:nicotinate phosphoribosyltransferase [Candidatus Sulfotelmatobacter sp.]